MKDSNFSFQIETVEAVEEEIKELIAAHWEEIALNKDVIKLNPDWDAYRKLEAEGYMAIYTCREDGVLIGYFVVMATNNLHYKDHIFATNDIIYLKPEYRHQKVGMQLIQFAEDDLRKRGVSVLCINTKVHQPFDKLMEHMGFNLIERVYAKCFLRETN